MNNSNSLKIACISLLFLCMGMMSRAELIAYDGFWDDEGNAVYNTQLHNQNTGIGWINAWKVTAPAWLDQENKVIESDPMTYPNLASGGGRFHMKKTSRPHYAKRTFTETPIGETGTSLWFSFLHKNINSDAEDRLNSFYLYNGSDAIVQCHGRTSGSKKWELQVGSVLDASSVSSINKLNLVVLRIDFKEGNDDVYMWAGTELDLSAELSIESASAQVVGAADFSIDALELRGGYYSETFWDEVRVATTYFDAISAIPPRVRNQLPTHVNGNSAQFNGTLVTGANLNTDLSVYWGTSDGGADSNAWEYVEHLGTAIENTEIFKPMTLEPNETYYYCFYASNDYGESWSPSAQPVSTKDITISATDSIGDETITNTITFRIARAADSVGTPLDVNLSFSGTAENGIDYALISDPCVLTFEADSAYADLTIVPKQDIETELSPESVIAHVIDGSYVVGMPNSATGYIHHVGFPSSPTNIWIGSGNASVDANWSLGHSPTATEIVYLDGYSHEDLLWDDMASEQVAGWIQGEHYTGTASILTRYSYDRLTQLSILGDMIIKNGSVAHTTNSGNQLHRLNLHIEGDLHVGDNGAIHGDALGFSYKNGPGKPYTPWSSGNDYHNGAAHGGTGGSYGATWTGTNTYGSILQPVDLGSGGFRNQNGGGALLLTVCGSTRVDGRISANAGNLSTGSGGSVWLTTGLLDGHGIISTIGGGGDADCSGGGGRIAIYVTNSDSIGENVKLYAHAGIPSRIEWNRWGGSGTIYIQTANDEDQSGTVRITTHDDVRVSSKSSHVHLPPLTLANSPSLYSDLRKANWDIQRAHVQLRANFKTQSLAIIENSTLNLNGYTLTVSEFYVNGESIPAGVYTETDFEKVIGAGEIYVTRNKTTAFIIR